MPDAQGVITQKVKAVHKISFFEQAHLISLKQARLVSIPCNIACQTSQSY